ncbi:lytic transglycosylase domain-containing protein [Rhizomicrobium electricum]|uniref:Lytic transglycosylase domain-containing protein n=1 Tax=Rhizomicrobium electricum TaxID=480070 RepID=A0ABN1F798_9PROT|nr:lytic transglycosylase domain-containing protein [Rhizomicrobium electricum]NIJ46661.1 hypothetical protein [Rhizomicrobium electricum]
MDPLSLLTACSLVFQPGPEGLRCATSSLQASAPSQRQLTVGNGQSGVSKWQGEIAQASEQFRMPEAWIGTVMGAESGGHTTLNGRPITSAAGAMGLMQLMPRTYDDMRQRYGLGTNPYDPHDNITAGAAYLRQMYERYGYPHLFEAYSAGPGRFNAYLKTGKPLPSETRAYVEKILPGVRLDGKVHPFEPDPVLPVSKIKKDETGGKHALFFVQSGARSASENVEVTAPTQVKNTRAEAVLFVPLSRDLHKPEN